MGKTGGYGMVSVPQIPCTTAFSTEASPRVSMITEMTGSPIIGRSSTRSIRMPSTAENTRVSTKAAQNGTW